MNLPLERKVSKNVIFEAIRQKIGEISTLDLGEEFQFDHADSFTPAAIANLSRKLSRITSGSGDEISLKLLRRLTRKISLEDDLSRSGSEISSSSDSVNLDLRDKVFTMDYAKKMTKRG
jgi:hypothetical protein